MKALKVKLENFFTEERATELNNWFVNEMPDWWWYKAIRSGEDGEDIKYIELNFGNMSEIESEKLIARRNLSKNKFTYSFNRTRDDHVDGCTCKECGLKEYFKSKEFMKTVQESTGISVSEVTESFTSWYDAGDWLSIHSDKPNGKVAFVYQLSKNWLPEYGGLLNYRSKTDDITAYLPEFNTLTLFTLDDENSFHFVSEVIKDCPERRLAHTGWLK